MWDLSSPQALFVLAPNGGTLLFLLIHLNFIHLKHAASISFFLLKNVLLNLLQRHWSVKLHSFQVYNSIICHLHIALWKQHMNKKEFLLFLWLIFHAVTKGTFTSLVQEHHLLVNSGNSGYMVHRKPDLWFLVMGSGLWLMCQVVEGERGVYFGPASVSHIEGFCAFIYKSSRDLGLSLSTSS